MNLIKVIHIVGAFVARDRCLHEVGMFIVDDDMVGEHEIIHSLVIKIRKAAVTIQRPFMP